MRPVEGAPTACGRFLSGGVRCHGDSRTQTAEERQGEVESDKGREGMPDAAERIKDATRRLAVACGNP